MSSHPRIITIGSDVLPDGTYAIVLSEGQDTVRCLSRDDTYRHAQAVLAAAQRAEYDAAVFRQMVSKLGLPEAAAAEAVFALRQQRVPLDAEALHPIGLEPGATTAGKPFIVVSLEGDRVGQWTPAQARAHALAALELAEAVEIDNAYYVWLLDSADLEPGHARAVVEDIANHRQPPTEAAK